MAVEWFYLLLKASAGSSGRPCGVYMFSGLTTLVINIYNITMSLLHGMEQNLINV